MKNPLGEVHVGPRMCPAKSGRLGGVSGIAYRSCLMTEGHEGHDHMDHSGRWTYESLRVYDVGVASRELADSFTKLFAAMIARDE